ncbi:hypothetical protein E4U31_006222 [Claviceps sp. LM219 group G6]|nr:hypothetical protein E4U31_006222 [Claviceps sp. LM219 group G6]
MSFRVSENVTEIQGLDNVDRICQSCGLRRTSLIWVSDQSTYPSWTRLKSASSLGYTFKYRSECTERVAIHHIPPEGCRHSVRYAARLFLLPSALNTIVIRPRNITTELGMIRQFKAAFRVRVTQETERLTAYWLNWLVHNNPSYHDVVIDPERWTQLPVDGVVSDQLPQQTFEADAAQAEQDFRNAAPQTMTESTPASTVRNSRERGRATPHVSPDRCGRVQGAYSPRTQRAGNSVNFNFHQDQHHQHHQIYHCVDSAAGPQTVPNELTTHESQDLQANASNR